MEISQEAGLLLNRDMATDEERKIWMELEKEIERSLEEEIKDGMRRHALLLHRLYHQRARGMKKNSSESKNRDFTELTINIRTGEGCKLQIQKSNMTKNAVEKARPQSTRPEAKECRQIYTGRRFDWSQTLRSDPSSAIFINGGKQSCDGNDIHEWKF